MPKDTENISFFDDLPQPTEPEGFSHQQMVRCDDCLRANPPTRLNCLYCGGALPQTESTVALAKPSLRPLEPWEQGYNNILMQFRDGEPSVESLNQVAALLRVEPKAIQLLLSAGAPLPLARLATFADAALVERRLRELGLETVVVADQELQIDTSPPRRLRTLELNETEMLAYQTGNADGVVIAWAEINLIVVGHLFVKQLELREKSSRKAEKQLLDSNEVSSDEAVLDFYAGTTAESWRINANGFDYSCLGGNKALLAGTNFPALVGVIRDRAPNAELNESYVSLRHCLEVAWPAVKRIEAGGVRKSRLGRISTGEIITTNSETQFTRYSRLCHHLKNQSPAGLR